MDITHISIRNCLTIGQADIELDNRGLLLVQGENCDDTSASSNGAGKSSILDALCWCIYGTTARDVSGDDIVNDTAKKDCSVMTMLNDGGTFYKVERFRKHKTHKNQVFVWQFDSGLTGPSTDLSKGTDRETQVVIDKIVGCSLDVFVGAIYAGQEKMPDLPGMTDKQLKLIVEEAAGVSELSEAYTEARQRCLKAEGEVKVAGANVKAASDALDAAKHSLEARDAERIAFEDGRKDRARAELTKVPPIQAKIAEFKDDLSKLDEPVLFCRRKVLQDELDRFKDQEAKLAIVVDAERKVGNELSSSRTALGLEQSALKRKEDDLANIHSQIGKPCGECGKAYCEHDLETAIKVREADITTSKTSLLIRARAYKEVMEKYTAAQKATLEFRNSMTDVSKVSGELMVTNGILQKIEILLNSIARLEEDKVNITAAAKVKLFEPNPHVAAVARDQTAIENLETAMLLRQAELQTLSENAELYSDAVKVFGPAGVRAHILDTVTPFLNEKTGEYLGALADGNIHATWSTLAKTAKGELKEKFNIEVTNDKGGKTFKALSGGEKRKVRISAAMALQDMVASRASKPINIFLADEIDHALDEPGLERLMSVLERKARERGTVIVVSHNSLSDWIDQVIHVKKSGGMSVVSGDTHRTV